MTAEERAFLRASPVAFPWWAGIASGVWVFVLTFLIVALAAIVYPYDAVVRGAITTAAVASVASYAWIRRRKRRAIHEQIGRLNREAEAGYVRSTVYRITDAVAVKEQEDEGLSYYLLLDDGRTLFLTGQYLYEAAEQGFPWRSFEIVKVASGAWVLRLVPLGPSIAPSATRAPFSDVEWSSGAVPADGSIDVRDFRQLANATP